MRIALSLVVVLAASFSGCAEQRTEDRPIVLVDDSQQQAVFDCSLRGDTGYSQGSPFPIQVVTVDGDPVEEATANAYIVMQEAAAEDGVNIRINSGFRTMDDQERLYSCYTECNCNNCNLAARPGYSNHQSGHALDLNTDNDSVLSWLEEHGDEYGFSRTVPSEDWHWEWWSGGPGGGPCGSTSACATGDFTGAFCDDEGSSSEAAHNCLVNDLHVDFHCTEVDGNPAFCGGKPLTRGELAFVLGNAAGIPLTGHPDAFSDDNGHIYEASMNAFARYGIYIGNGVGTGNVDGGVARSTIAMVIARMYGLPDPTRDYFIDDAEDPTIQRAQNQLGDIGFDTGCGGGNFCGSDLADRSTSARFACGLSERTLTPVWLSAAQGEGEGDAGEGEGDVAAGEGEGEGAGPAGIEPMRDERILDVRGGCGGCDSAPASSFAIALVLLWRSRRRAHIQ
jgi:D-alanyl-D-alanine carboxypeptidase